MDKAGFFFYCEGGQTWAWIAQRDCGVSILAEVQNLIGLSPGQSVQGDPAPPVGLDELSKFLKNFDFDIKCERN